MFLGEGEARFFKCDEKSYSGPSVLIPIKEELYLYDCFYYVFSENEFVLWTTIVRLFKEPIKQGLQLIKFSVNPK